jgi:hypothetical protein
VDAAVQVQGKVSRHAPLLGKTAYELEDATGKIWVVSKDTPPAIGAEVSIRGIVRHQPNELERSLPFTYLEQQ